MRKLSAAPAELGLAVRFRAVTYTIGENIYLRSDCPGADPLLRGGADGLPAGGQTDQQRVASLLEAGGSWLIERFGAVEVRAIPRNGQVWVGPGDGIYQVIEAIDSQIEVVLGPEAACPQAPYLWNGIPLLFTRGN